MDKTYILLLFAEKPCDVYVALSKTTQSRDQIASYITDKYLRKPQWKYILIAAFLE